MEEEQKLTLRQKIAYAHWSAKFAFSFPWFGTFAALLVGLMYLGIAFWFFEPEITSLRHFSGAHALAKSYFANLAGLMVIFALSFVTVYIPYFIWALFDNDTVCRKYFIRSHYRKH